MRERTTWFVNATVITPRGLLRGAVGVEAGRILGVRRRAPSGAPRLNVRGQYVAPGLIDLHIWGEPQRVARQEVRSGVTSFLTTVGPQPPELLVNALVRLEGLSDDGARPSAGSGRASRAESMGARCLGVHLEGPFLNPFRAGALASRWLRSPTSRELRQLLRWAGNRLKLVTIAPEIPRAMEAIRWLSHRRVIVSLGHSDASGVIAQRAIRAGARAVTHVYNGMRPLHHRDPGLLGEVLTDDRLTAMVILDGVHVDPVAFQLLLRCKGPQGIILVTDSIRHQANRPRAAGGAFYKRRGILAGSRLTMLRAVRNAVAFGKIPLSDAVQMASRNPARLLGLQGQLGSLEEGRRADLVVFDQRFRAWLTMIDGSIVYQRRR